MTERTTRVLVVLRITMLPLAAGQASAQTLSSVLPAPSAVSAPQFTCTEVVSTSISSENTKPVSVTAEARRGREIFYMRLMGETLNLVSKAEATIGETAGHPMPVASSTPEVIWAMSLDAPGSSMSFLLQRKSGYAVWTRTGASTWLGANAPNVQSVYFSCK